MKEYYYHSNTDSSKEKLGTVKAADRLDAIHMFSKRKRLPVFKFLELFRVVEKK